MKPKIQLDAGQRLAFDQLRQAVQGIADLTSADAETLEAWLDQNFGISPCVRQAMLATLESIRNFDERDDSTDLWDHQVDRLVLGC